MALKLPPEAHNQSPLFGALWAIFMIRGPSKFILQKDATQKYYSCFKAAIVDTPYVSPTALMNKIF